ncbi:MAG: hypothetical protein H7Z75_15120 [Ferruginibacter sp.]|nr:hypothetical protein [Cytophagales bacterium]
MKTILLGLIVSTFLRSGAMAQQSTGFKSVIAVWEYTYLKSFDGQHEQLLRFIEKNWFAMDSIASRQGLMVDYELFETGEKETGDWNVVVAVAYPSRNGYEAIEEKFESIRRGHVKVLIEGKDLAQLGRIVLSQKLYPRTP